MSELPPSRGGDRPRITPARVVVWVVVAGIGVYLFVTGIVGIIAKG